MAKNFLEVEKNLKTYGQRLSDKLTNFMGSWTFIIIFAVFILVWVGANLYGWIRQWDPFPFIFLNLTLSLLAAVQAPIILMSQSREAQKEKIRAKIDYDTDKKAEEEITEVKKEVSEIKKMLQEMKQK